MASQTSVSGSPTTSEPFGAWLRRLREARRLPQRALAAAAEMDSSHYGKVETGKRFLTDEQAAAVAPILGLDRAEILTRLIAARLLAECDGDHSLAHRVADIVQEQAAPYLVNNPANNRAKKK